MDMVLSTSFIQHDESATYRIERTDVQVATPHGLRRYPLIVVIIVTEFAHTLPEHQKQRYWSTAAKLAEQYRRACLGQQPAKVQFVMRAPLHDETQPALSTFYELNQSSMALF